MVRKEIPVITGMLKPLFLMLTLYIIIISVYNMFQNGDTIFKNYIIVLKRGTYITNTRLSCTV